MEILEGKKQNNFPMKSRGFMCNFLEVLFYPTHKLTRIKKNTHNIRVLSFQKEIQPPTKNKLESGILSN